MCLGIPVKIIERYGEFGAKVEYGGVTQSADLRFTPKARVGDYVILHAGFAIEIVDKSQALKTHKMIEDLP